MGTGQRGHVVVDPAPAAASTVLRVAHGWRRVAG
jgi:hypothetical protein